MAFQDFKAWKIRTSMLAAKVGFSADSQSLRGKVVRNVSWIMIGYGAEIVIRFLSSLIMTRLLDPGSYGLLSTIMVFMTISMMLSELGLFHIVLTSERGDNPEFLHTIWTLQILRGLALMTILCTFAGGWYYLQLSGVIVPHSQYANPLLPELLGILAFSLAASGFETVNNFRLARHMQQGPETRLAIATRLSASVLSVILTFWLRSIWGVAIAMTLNAIVRSFLTHRFIPGPRMRLRFNRDDMRSILGRSRWLALDSGMSVLATSGDKLIVGYGFGFGVLGVWYVANNITDSFSSLVLRVQRTMGVSFLNQVKHKSIEEQHRAFYKFRLPIELCCIAAGLGFTFLGSWFFQLVYDPRYAQAGVFAAYFGAGMIVIPLKYSSSFAMRAQRFKYLAVTSSLRTIFFFGAMIAAVFLGKVELAAAAVALQRVPEALIYFLIPRSNIPFRWSRDGLLLGLATACVLYSYLT